MLTLDHHLLFWCEGGARVSERSKEWLKSEEGAALHSPSSS